MKNTYTAAQQEELFAKDCKLINLKYEYAGYTGSEKWAIITELSETDLWEKYPDVISRYTLITITNLPPRAMMGIDSCDMLLSAIHEEEGEEKLHLLMVDNHIPAGAKLY